jgi:hypothetical protein
MLILLICIYVHIYCYIVDKYVRMNSLNPPVKSTTLILILIYKQESLIQAHIKSNEHTRTRHTFLQRAYLHGLDLQCLDSAHRSLSK